VKAMLNWYIVLQLLITLLSFIGMSKSRSAVIHLSCLLYVVVFTSLMKENYKRGVPACTFTVLALKKVSNKVIDWVLVSLLNISMKE
jgi:hypothetical protein